MQTSQSSFKMFSPVVVLIIAIALAIAGFTVWALQVRAETKTAPESASNAYCTSGSCYRTNGMYIGPDPATLPAGRENVKVPEYVPSTCK